MTKTRDLANLGGGFIQAGTGAVQRTVESKLQDVVSVLDFIPQSEHANIKNGTSTYNATADIQAAVTFANGSNKAVFIPAGEYLIGQITLPSNSCILGESREVSILKLKASQNKTVLAANSSNNVTIARLSVDYNPANNSGTPIPGESSSAVSIASFCTVSDCEFIGCVGAAVIGYGSDNEVSDCYFHNGAYTAPVAGICVNFIGSTGLSRNRIFNNVASGIANGFAVNNTGIVGVENYFAHNRVSNLNPASPANSVAAGINAWNCKNTVIESNTVIQSGGPGIRLIANSTGSIVVNNMVRNCGLSGYVGIDIGDSDAYNDDYLTISGNYVEGTGGPGFWLTSVHKSIISNNTSINNGITLTPQPGWVTDFWKAGFVLDSENDSATTPVANNQFVGNVCFNNTYAVSRSGINPGVIVENTHVGNYYQANSSSYNIEPSTDVFLGNNATGIPKIINYRQPYGSTDGAVFSKIINTSTSKQVEFGFDNNFAAEAGFVIQSNNSIGFAIGTNNQLSNNRAFVINPTKSARFIPLASAPASPKAGDTYYDNGTNKLRCYNGTTWNDLF